MISFYWKDKWWKLMAWFNPRQKWLTKKIPNTWCDKTELIPLILFEILTDFVENEDGLESIWGERYLNDPHVSEEYRQQREPIRKELEEIYEYIKNERPLLQKQLDEAYPVPVNGGDFFDRCEEVLEDDGKTVKHYRMKSCEEIYGKSFQEAYADVHRIEALIEDKDTWAMTGIIKNRAYLWT